mmetsp:Transcript_8833/g.14194  ORF Transcript_8833/g.14194 Transcript_8833/m.14194 type:complete len:270 (-) Transcript_8833:489-1298(-)
MVERRLLRESPVRNPHRVERDEPAGVLVGVRKVVYAVLGGQRERHLQVGHVVLAARADSAVALLGVVRPVPDAARPVFVLHEHLDETQVDVAEEGVLVHAVGGDTEEVGLLQVDVRLRREGVEGRDASGPEVCEAEEGVDSVLNAHGAAELPGERAQLHLVNADFKIVLPEERICHRQVDHPARGRHSLERPLQEVHVVVRERHVEGVGSSRALDHFSAALIAVQQIAIAHFVIFSGQVAHVKRVMIARILSCQVLEGDGAAAAQHARS